MFIQDTFMMMIDDFFLLGFDPLKSIFKYQKYEYYI